MDSNTTVACELPTCSVRPVGVLEPFGICGVTWTYIEAFCPCCTELGTCVKATESVGSGGGGGVGVGVSDGVGDADADSVPDGVGDGVVPAAKAAEAVLLTRTTPVPTLMISGFRTDRASTAHDLLNNRL